MRPDDLQAPSMQGTTAGTTTAGTTTTAQQVAAMTDPASGSALTVRQMARVGAVAGILGPLMLVAYFSIPAFVTLPSATATADQVIRFANAHQRLFYLAGWLQVTGALLSTVFFLVLVQLTGSVRRLSGLAALAGSTLLLGVVAIEAVMLEAVPMAAGNGDRASVSTTYALSNGGVFVRIFPLAPASLVFAGVGLVLLESRLLPAVFARSALVISALFLVAGIAAVIGGPGVVFAIVMSVVEAIWIPATAVALARWRPGE
jgi:hypothetical protein